MVSETRNVKLVVAAAGTTAVDPAVHLPGSGEWRASGDTCHDRLVNQQRGDGGR
jgi:hypothetical protein